MRIDILGEGGFNAADMLKSLDTMYDEIKETLDGFQDVKMSLSRISGGISNLSGSYDNLNDRISAEKAKLVRVETFSRKTAAFLSNTINTDKSVEKMVSSSQEDFFNMRPWLRPVSAAEKPWWEEWAENWNSFWGDVGETIADAFGSICEYLEKSFIKLILGDYSDENITLLSLLGSIVMGIFDVDLPLDIRDLFYDLTHFELKGEWFLFLALDVVALIPVIGALKYFKYADDVADGAKDLGKVIEAGGDIGKYSDDIADAVDDAKDIGKTVDAATDAGKTTDTVVDSAEDVTDLGKKTDVASDAGKIADDADDFLVAARKAADNYNLDEERYLEHIVERHGFGSTYRPNRETKFIQSFDIKKGIKDTLTDLSITPKPNTYNRPGYIFEKVFDKVIGVAPDGTELNKLKVVLDEAGNVVTAYPIK